MSDDEIVGIYSHPYGGRKKCMGYPHGCRKLARAEWWFMTPQVLLDIEPNSEAIIYLCHDCWTEWNAAIALGIVFPAF